MTFKHEKKRNEVISLRLNDERVEILERHRQVLMEQLHRPVSLSEAAFLVIENRAEMVDRETQRHELLKNPVEALWSIRRKWETEHSLSGAEWDVLAIYLQIGAEEQRQEPQLLRPASPSRASYLVLLEAFEGVLRMQREFAQQHLWYYFANLDGPSNDVRFAEDDATMRYEAVLRLIAIRKAQLQAEDDWKYPGSIGRCLLTAVQSEAADSNVFNQAFARYWPVLWRIAARGHWLRHQAPVRILRPDWSGPAERQRLPGPVETRGLALSFIDGGGGDVAFHVEFRAPRNFTYIIPRYPALIEFHAMLEGLGQLPAWNGRYFHAVLTSDKESGETNYTLWPRQQDLHIDFTEKEWHRLRDSFRLAWEKPEIVERMAALQLEYGEQG
jgi:hypothetical protein